MAFQFPSSPSKRKTSAWEFGVAFTGPAQRAGDKSVLCLHNQPAPLLHLSRLPPTARVTPAGSSMGWSAWGVGTCVGLPPQQDPARSPPGMWAAECLLCPTRPGSNPWQELWNRCRLLKLFRFQSFFLYRRFHGIPAKSLARSCRLSALNS